MKKISLILIALLIAACGPQGQIPQNPVLKLFERESGLIAYIGLDGNVYITDQSASNTTQITDDVTQETMQTMIYQQPTWSQTGNQLAFIRLEQNGSSLKSEILVADTENDSVRSVYASDTEYPFYLYWSPDGNNITALTSTASQRTLVLKSIPVDGGEPRVLDTGNPFYWSWAPDGKTMIVHKNGGNPNAINQLAFLKVGDEVSEFVTETPPATFQAPAWSPDGAYILLTSVSENDKQELVIADSTGEVQKTVAEFELNTAFAWASDSRQFAYIAGTEQMQEGALGSLHVHNVETNEEIVVDEPVFAFFWSPDAIEVAYLVPFLGEAEGSSQQQLFFTLYILDIASKESREVVTFQPTENFVSIIPYIDQYHQSLTIWSPDSNNLVISFISQQGTPGIAVIPVSGITEPRVLVEGYFAVWSWK